MSNNDETKKVNISISLKTHTKAKLISVLNNKTLNEYFAQAIEKAVEKDKNLIKSLMEDDK